MRSLVLLSGGMDSSTLAAMSAEADPKSVDAIGFFYGQRHERELDAALSIANHLNLNRFDVIDISSLQIHLTGSALTDESIAVPHGHYAEDNMRSTVVPNRNMIMLSIACGIAVAREMDEVAVAVHAGDHAIYPDCRPAFISSFNETVRLATEGFSSAFNLVTAPFVAMTKADICRIGNSLRVPFEKTHSCYEGNLLHCGRCGTCVERRESFDISGIFDPTEYADLDFYHDLKHQGIVGADQ